MWDQEFELAKKTALKVGDFLRSQASREVLSSEDKDVKAKADKDAEAIILQDLTENSIHAILSEESYEDFSGKDGELFWVVDPIDGTLNFLRGLDYNCVSIALWKSEKPILGVIYDFNRNLLYSSLKGKGVFLNDVALSKKDKVTQDNAIIFTGFPSFLKHDEETLNAYIKMIQAYKKVRLIGSAALSICNVAAGVGDAYYEKEIRFWDVAAGLAMTTELGFDHRITFNANYFCEVLVSNVAYDT